jgi:predicted ester cyclase
MNMRLVHLLAALAMMAATGCKSAEKPNLEAMGQESSRLLFEYMRASNAKNAKELKSYYAENVVTEYVDHLPAARIEGRDKLVEDSFQESWKAFPDAQFEPLRVLIKGKEIVIISLATGTNTGPIMGMPPTEERIGILSGYHWTLNEEGKIASEVVYMDQSVLPGQLGLLPDTSFRPAAPPSGNPPRVAITTGSEQERASVKLIESMLRAFNAHDVKGTAKHYKDSAVYSYMPDPEDHRGRKAIAAALGEYFDMSSDVKASHDWIWGADDYVAARTVHSGTNDGEPPGGGEATGKPFKTVALDVYKVVNGEITRHWTFANASSLPVQLGLAQATE